MARKIKVGILDNHQSVVDAYVHQLCNIPEIDVVAIMTFGEELGPTLAVQQLDVLLLDICVPESRLSHRPFPIIDIIPKVLDLQAELNILVSTTYLNAGLIRLALKMGASGYILKDDLCANRDLGDVIHAVANGQIYLSQRVHQALIKRCRV